MGAEARRDVVRDDFEDTAHGVAGAIGLVDDGFHFFFRGGIDAGELVRDPPGQGDCHEGPAELVERPAAALDERLLRRFRRRLVRFLAHQTVDVPQVLAYLARHVVDDVLCPADLVLRARQL